MKLPQLSDNTKRVIAFVMLGLAVVVGFAIQNNDRYAAKRQSCLGSLENRQLLADVIGNSQSGVQQPIDSNLDPTVQDLIRKAQEEQKRFLAETQAAFDKPLDICESVGIESRVRIRNKEGVELVPLPAVSNEPSATSSTSASSGVIVVPGATGPQGPTGPAGPPGSSAAAPTTTESVAPPTTVRLLCVGGICIG